MLGPNPCLQTRRFKMACLPTYRAPLLLLMLTLLLSMPTPGKASDAEILFQLKESFTYGYTLLSSWSGNDPCNNWLGVSCTAGRVTVL